MLRINALSAAPREVGTTVKLILAFAALGTVGCTNLSEVVYEEITEENFNPTSKDLAALIAPAYTPLRAVWTGWHGMLDYQEETADALVTPVRLPRGGWYDGGIYIRLHEHTWDANQTQPNSFWIRAFNGINSANRVIHQIESGIIELEEAVKTNTLAELRALRAYYYSLLLDTFGNVPVVTDFTDTELPEQRTRQEVYDFVISELTAAMPSLSVETGAKTYGRMTQWAAKGILARAYLNAEVYTGAAQWQKVLDLTDEIISSGKYRLEASYRTPFSRNNNTSVENIWVVQYHEVFAQCSNFHMKTLKPELQFAFQLAAQPWGGSSANPQFIDTYDPDDARLSDTWLMGPHFDDQRRGYDFVQHIPSMTKSEFYHGFPVWKYEIYAGQTGCSDVDYPILRYAEVLMMKAEALLRSGQADAAATIVTQVRERNFQGATAGKATVTGAELTQGSRYNYGWYDEDGVVKTGPGGAPVEQGGADIQYGRFLDELGWEFAAEGHRRQQLIRFQVYTTKTWFNHRPNGDHRTIFAIPNSVLQTNTKLEQNPGY
jgi:starch-binding outer membrane protein, SusD/RagB family